MLATIGLIGGWTVIRVVKDPTESTDNHGPRPRRRLKNLFRPSSVYIPTAITVLALIYIFRALETYQIALPQTDEYHMSCPQASRRTRTGVLVKLFAASVTTLGIHGHLDSLIGSSSWKRQLFRAIEVLISPLASVFLFTTLLWYGFADLLGLHPGLWEQRPTFRYRLAMLCHCHVAVNASPTPGRFLHLGYVSPHHTRTVPSSRDLRWVGRVLLLLILLGQYAQAAVLLTRRLLSDTASAIDYGMFFLVLSGSVALLQSLTILLLNVSWVVNANTVPCAEKACRLPGCVDPETRTRAILFGYDVTQIPRTVWYELAAGYVQLAVLWRSPDSAWMILLGIYGLHGCWEISVHWLFSLQTLSDVIHDEGPDVVRDEESTATGAPVKDNRQPGTGTLPSPVVQDENNNGPKDLYIPNLSEILVYGAFLVLGVGVIVVNCAIMVVQAFYLLRPCAFLYSHVASDLASWSRPNPMAPCPQLWKDGLEDELWWF